MANYAIVIKETKRVIGIVDETMVEHVKKIPYYLTVDFIPIHNIGNCSFKTEYGIVNTISVCDENTHLVKDFYHMINSKPNNLTSFDCYEAIGV